MSVPGVRGPIFVRLQVVLYMYGGDPIFLRFRVYKLYSESGSICTKLVGSRQSDPVAYSCSILSRIALDSGGSDVQR